MTSSQPAEPRDRAPTRRQVRVLLVHEHPVVRHGLRLLLQSSDEIEMVAEAIDGEDAVTAATRHRPDVLVMDLHGPHGSAADTTAELVRRAGAGAPAVLVLTASHTDQDVAGAARAGVRGYVITRDPSDALVAAIRALADGDGWLSPPVARQLLDQYRPVAPTRPEQEAKVSQLSDRERVVLRLVALGRSNAEIADELVLSEATVKTHVSRILGKLGVRDRVQAAGLAYRAGLAQAH